MSATERLRELLDARGVEHYHEPNYVKWDDANQHQCFAFETYERPGLLRVHCNLTPEQAIAATLGAGECEMNRVKMFPEYDDCMFECWECSACKRTNEEQHPNYCPWCGRRCV